MTSANFAIVSSDQSPGMYSPKILLASSIVIFILFSDALTSPSADSMGFPASSTRVFTKSCLLSSIMCLALFSTSILSIAGISLIILRASWAAFTALSTSEAVAA